QVREDRRAAAEPALQRVLEVEQAEVVLAPLAYHHRAAAVGPRLRPGARAFVAQLALEVLGESRDPHRALRFLRPQRGGREVAERLADAGAGLGQQQVRGRAARARGEHPGGLAGVAALAFAVFGAFAGQLGEP